MSETTQEPTGDVVEIASIPSQRTGEQKPGEFVTTDNHTPIAPEGETPSPGDDGEVVPMDNHTPIAPGKGVATAADEA